LGLLGRAVDFWGMEDIVCELNLRAVINIVNNSHALFLHHHRLPPSLSPSRAIIRNALTYAAYGTLASAVGGRKNTATSKRAGRRRDPAKLGRDTFAVFGAPGGRCRGNTGASYG